MKKLITILLIMLISAPLGAADRSWYLGGGVIGTRVETKGLAEGLSSVGLVSSQDEIDGTATGIQVFGGLMFSRNWGMEIKYSDSGDADETISILEPESMMVVPVNVEINMSGFTFYAVGTFPFTEKFEGSVKLGGTFQDGELKANVFGFSESASDDDSGVAMAGLLRYRFTPNWSMSGELEYFDVDFDSSIEKPLRLGLNVEYTF